MPLTIQTRSRYDRSYGFTPCENGCDDPRASGWKPGRASASHRAELMGHDIYLCTRCAKEWAQVWKDNGGQVVQRQPRRVHARELIRDLDQLVAA